MLSVLNLHLQIKLQKKKKETRQKGRRAGGECGRGGKKYHYLRNPYCEIHKLVKIKTAEK